MATKKKTARSWTVKKIDHIGIAVRNLEESVATFKEKFGLSKVEFVDVKDQALKMALVEIGSTCFIELMEPTDPNGTVARFLAKMVGRDSVIHHIAFAVDRNLEDVANDLTKRGIEMVYPKPRLGVKSRPINFCHPKSTSDILIEICDVRHEKSS